MYTYLVHTQCNQPHSPSSIKCAKYEPCGLTNSFVSRRWWIWRAGTWLCFSPTGATHNSTRRTASKLVLVTPAWWCSSARNGSCWLSICGRFWPLVFAAAGIFHDPCEWEFSCVSCSRSSCCYYNIWIYMKGVGNKRVFRIKTKNKENWGWSLWKFFWTPGSKKYFFEW